MSDPDALARLIAEVQASAKYRQVTPELIRRLGAQELARRHSFKEAVKATKNKLHQVGAVYFPAQARYHRWLAQLTAAGAASPEALRAVCREIMAGHASTRERLPLLDQLYARALAEVAPVSSVIDVACGFHPLAIPWMPLAPGARYQAMDIYVDLMAFLDAALPLLGVQGHAMAADVLQSPPREEAEVAFLFKAIPCLEQIDRGAGLWLLEQIPARHLLVSFPVQSLGGREKGMRANYEAHLRDLVAAHPWTIAPVPCEGELIFWVHK